MADHSQSTSSALMAMHQRYEATMAESLLIEHAEQRARRNRDDDRFAFERAGLASCREADALRTAILHQVPASWAEAAVLQFHVTCAFDMMANCEDYPADERAALQTAIDTLFDFMACEMKEDHEQFGVAFKDGAVRAHFVRRHRTGEMGE